MLVACGYTNRQIADVLGISTGTVKNYLRRARQRLGLKNRTQVAVWSIENGLIDVESAYRAIAIRRRKPV